MSDIRKRILYGVESERVKIRARTFDVIRTLLDPMVSPPPADVRRGLLAPPPRARFQCIDPINTGLHDDEEWWIFHPDDCTPDVCWPLDVCFLIEKEGEWFDILVHRVTSVSPAEVRGVATRTSRFMVMDDILVRDLNVGGKVLTARGVLSWIGRRWADANGHREYHRGTDIGAATGRLEAETHQAACLATSLALRHRYEWAVAVGFPQTPTVRFATDPTGIREIFRFRDMPAGKDRRDALLHWVTEHWRTLRKDPSAESYVRPFARGRVDFEWDGMTVSIRPPQYDLDKLSEAEMRAIEMRAKGEHIRPKGSPR